MSSACYKCCTDMDIDPLDLLFPFRMSADGKEFVAAHGLEDARLADLQTGAILMSDGKVKIQHRCQQLDEVGLCRIYENRPTICRNYVCTDRRGPGTCLLTSEVSA